MYLNTVLLCPHCEQSEGCMSIPNAASVDVNIGAFCHLAWTASLSRQNYANATTVSLRDTPGDALPTVLHEKPILNLSFTHF